MFEGKPLSKITYADLDAFLREENEEGTRLDYKREMVSDVTKIACAFANTAGGHLVIGVDEKRKKGVKAKIADPDNVPGLARKDWEASLLGKIRDLTRPPVVPEVKALDVPGKPDRVVVVVRVAESVNAPHESHHSSGPEIPVRRADDTKSAGLDDVERMIYARDRAREGLFGVPEPKFFWRMLAPEPTYALGSRPEPPTVAATIRPRRLLGVAFDFDSDLDEKLMDLGTRTGMLRTRAGYTASQGMVSLEYPGRGEPEQQRLELHRTGGIHAARALRVEVGEARMRNEAAVPGERWLDFDELIGLVLGAARFGAGAYGISRPGSELEVLVSYSQCHGHRTRVRTSGSAYEGTMADQAGPASFVAVRTDADGNADPEGLANLVKEASRAFGVRAPDEALRYFTTLPVFP